ncbi:Sds3-like-domain-containing protein [Chlamydoabsidia padenii]|nr:Sds3-like-domain-containing protein [Chlamydoabsidia padenii]
MPLASLLETNKPFVFASSHSNGSSTELSSPTLSSLPPRQVNSPPPPQVTTTVNHTKPLLTSLDRGHYHTNDYDSSTLDDTTKSEPPPSSYYNGQVTRPNGDYNFSSSTKSMSNTSYPTSSTHNPQLLSPSTPASTVPPTTTSSPPPPSLEQDSLPFTTQLPTPHLQDTSITLPSPKGLNQQHNVPSPQQNPMDHHLIQQKQLQQEGMVTNKKTPPPLLGGPLAKENILPPPTISATKRGAGQHNINEGDSGYFDNSTTENRRVKRRKELNQRIDGLTNDFNQNRERIFAEKLLLIQNEINQAHNNTHQQYKEGLILLESTRQKTIDHGQLFRDYQTQVTDRQFTLEIHHAEEEYLAERNEVREKLFAVLEEKRRKLKEDKDNCDLAYDVVLESHTRMNKRSLRKRGMENGDGKLNKRKQLSVPAIVFRLKDEEMYDDLQAMRNGLSIQAKKPSHKKK